MLEIINSSFANKLLIPTKEEMMIGPDNKVQMIEDSIVRGSLDNCMVDTDFLGLPNGRKGKFRDIYETDKHFIFITTDRQSAFDRVLAAVPFKGQVLNMSSAFWFEETDNIVPNHVVDANLDPNITIAKKCKVIPVEMVVRGYLTGSTSTSAWTRYQGGERNMNGNVLPDGMVKNQPFPKPILTPTTKEETGDRNMSPEEMIEAGIIDEETWRELADITLSLFIRGQEVAGKNGLILVDTKYEFGKNENGVITLIDEIHTPDSSRWWMADSYQERFQTGQEPENIDKEFLRLWFKENCDPYNDKTLPKAPDDLVVELSRRYIKLCEMITGIEFQVPQGNVKERIKRNIKDFLK